MITLYPFVSYAVLMIVSFFFCGLQFMHPPHPWVEQFSPPERKALLALLTIAWPLAIVAMLLWLSWGVLKGVKIAGMYTRSLIPDLGIGSYRLLMRIFPKRILPKRKDATVPKARVVSDRGTKQ